MDHRAETRLHRRPRLARQQLLPWAVADTHATWYAAVGRNLFDEQEEAFQSWTEAPEYLRRWDQ